MLLSAAGPESSARGVRGERGALPFSGDLKGTSAALLQRGALANSRFGAVLPPKALQHLEPPRGLSVRAGEGLPFAGGAPAPSPGRPSQGCLQPAGLALTLRPAALAELWKRLGGEARLSPFTSLRLPKQSPERAVLPLKSKATSRVGSARGTRAGLGAAERLGQAGGRPLPAGARAARGLGGRLCGGTAA